MSTEVRDALTAAQASALVQKRIDPYIIELSRRFSPLVDALPSKQWDSTDFYFDNVSQYPAGGFVTDGGAVAQSTSTYGQASTKIKLVQSVGGVTGFARAVTRGIAGDLLAREQMYAARGHLWDIENALLYGNATATSDAIPSASDGGAPQFDGLDVLVSTYSGAAQNAIDEANAAVTLSILNQIEDMVQVNLGMPVQRAGFAWIMSTTMRMSIGALLTKQQRFLGSMELKAGLRVLTYDDLPIIETSFLSARSVVVGTVTGSTSFGTNGGAIANGVTTHYRVSYILSRFGETAASADVSITTGANANNNVNSLTLPVTAPSVEGSIPLLAKVYSGTANNNQTLLGTVPMRDVTGAAVTVIMDNGVALLTNNQANTGTTVKTAYVGTNAGQHPRDVASGEEIYLIPLDENYLCRPYTRHLEELEVAPTITSPDQLPFALASDTALAVRAAQGAQTKYVGRGSRIATAL